MYLIFDASAISKPKDWKAPFSDTFAWPRLLHLSWIILDGELKPMENHNYVIKPDGFEIDEDILKFTRLDQKEIDARSTPLEEALHAFDYSLGSVDYVTAHNLNFSESVVAAEFLRKGISHSLFKKKSFCLMQESTFFCKIPTRAGGYKWPTLTELHSIIFNKAYSPPNNARADVIAATRCFKALMMGKQLDDIFDDEDQ